MPLLLVAPTLLSLVVFCAHLVRNGALLLVLPVLLSLPLLLAPRGWVARFFQALLFVAALEWIRTAVFLALARHDEGQGWLRGVVILGAVALFTLFSAALFETPTLLRVYPRRRD